MARERKTSDIHTSEDIRKVLNLFKDKSIFAKLLLKKRIPKEFLVEDHINYFDMSQTDPTKISYLTTDRIKLISQSTDDDFWSTSRRYKGKPGALLNKIFKDVPGKEVELFATLWKTFSVEESFRLEVVGGEDIRKYYNQENHYKEWGTLGNSCMKYEKCQKYLDIYVDNDVEMLVMLDKRTDKVIGRALLWKDNKGNKVMDRIYTIQDDEYLNHFIRWADINGYYYKKHQNWYSCLQFLKNGKEKELIMEIDLKKFDYSYVPYLDTFKFLDTDKGVLSNFCNDYDNINIKCLVSPSGGWERAGYLRLDEISREFCYYGDLIRIINSSGNEIFTSSDNCYWSDTYNSWILNTEAIWEERLNDYIYLENSRNDQSKIDRRIADIEKERERDQKRQELINNRLNTSLRDNWYDIIGGSFNNPNHTEIVTVTI